MWRDDENNKSEQLEDSNRGCFWCFGRLQSLNGVRQSKEIAELIIVDTTYVGWLQRSAELGS
jgi:hypothetical protein